ncbi:MAG TPA: phosphoribosylanthranilate isomerase [Longimicrobiales bacterium]|nr:phosphoribosylanthranilate isomerase [Longimicrobiales bacterium]
MDVKICGVCTPADAELVASSGADWLGVILAPGRSRSRTVAEAAAIYAAGDGVRRVGVFVNAGVEEMVEASDALRLDCVQLHGDEAPEVGARLARALDRSGRRVAIWKAVAVQQADDPARVAGVWQGVAHGLLLEGWSAAGHGGVGARFDWAAAAGTGAALPSGMQLVLAGGLDPDNVGTAIRLLRPDVVDVSSGVEQALCRKSAERVRAFIAAARAAAG